MGTQKLLVMKNKGSINNTLLTAKPRSQWDGWPRDAVNPIQFGTFTSSLAVFLKDTRYLGRGLQGETQELLDDL